jgi:EAL domain-containing protein (putative c-di-GMP-specific phosphodiesterase class I)
LGLKPRDIVFEVIESEHVSDRFHLRGILTFYRQAGFLVALDDVGAGFSGLTLLSELKPDIIKIDMALVRDIDQDRYKQSIVRHLIGIARETGTTVLAEGIETEAEKAWLIQADVELLQGYLIGKPSPVGAVAA